MITIEKCSCNQTGCRDYHLKGIGKFVQGSGFTKAEATHIAKLLNQDKIDPFIMDLAISQTHFQDVKQFHEKFDLMVGTTPRKLTKRKLIERIEFLYEEFSEFVDGCGVSILSGNTFAVYNDAEKEQDISEQADALIDLVYVALGTAVMMGLPWQELWDDVQRANLAKVRGVSHRGHRVDCVKPEGWEGPKTLEILINNDYNPLEEVYFDDQKPDD